MDLAHSLRAFRAVWGNSDLRRVDIAFFGLTMARLATLVALLVWAYEAGGPAAASLASVVQLVPAAVFAPLASLLGDRFRRDRVLVAAYLAQSLALALTAAALFATLPLAIVYTLAAVTAAAMSLIGPVQTAMLPTLARTPEELTAATAAAGLCLSVSLFGGPAVAGLLLDLSGPRAVFAAMAAVALGSAALVARLGSRPTPAVDDRHEGSPGIIGELLGGFRVLAADPGPRLVVLGGALFVVVGVLDLLIVVLAFRLLDTGSAGAAFLTSAFGVGAIVGAGMTVVLAGRPRLAPVLLAGAIAWGIALGLLGASANVVTAPLLVGVAGTSRMLIDVAGRTLLLRLVANDVLARVFGVVEGVSMAGLALGTVVAPASAALLGVRVSFVVAGVVFPALMVLTWRRLVTVDATTVVPEYEIALLRALAIFAPLPVPVIERVARRLHRIAAPAGSVVIREGDPGDRFYVIAEGAVDVSVAGRQLASLGPGDCFGEIALLRDIPRTATVSAHADTILYAIERADFLLAVTGNPESTRTADAIARARLDEQRPQDSAAD